MGREVRMVPPNWESPKTQVFTFRGVEERCQPMFDRRFEDAAAEWRKEFAEWEGGGRAAHRAESGEDYEFWEWHGNPPDRKYYRPWRDEEATWFQVWETVSEGTPVTPAFATREELAQYLSTHGDYWDQSRGEGPWSAENAARFVSVGWAPSGVFVSGKPLPPKESMSAQEAPNA